MKKITISVSLLLAMSLVSPAFAAPKKDFKLPPDALEVAPGLYKLGTKFDTQSDSFVEGYAFVHRNSAAKTGSLKFQRNPICYAVMATGAKWKSLEDWTVFPANSGLDSNFLLANTASNIGKWETAAGANILGQGTFGAGVATDPYVLDNKNEVSFGSLDGNTIAVTVVWGFFGGPTFSRSLVAWDQIFNTNYPWSTSGEVNKMDYENISSHELGHAMGLADIYNSSCSDVTMYGYASFGETNKRTLEVADVTGINLLY